MSFLLVLFLLFISPLSANDTSSQHAYILPYIECSDAFCIPEKFDVKFNKNIKIGHIVRLSFPAINQELKRDFTLVNPENPAEKVEAAIVLTSIEWQGGYDEPMEICGRYSSQNRAIFQEALASSDSECVIEMEIVLYEYDICAGQFFKRFYTLNKLFTCALVKQARIFVGLNPEPTAHEVSSPITFMCSFLVAPQPSLDKTFGFAFRVDGMQFIR